MDVDRAGRGELTVHHVDVFTDRALAGNGLTVVSSPTPLEPDTMLRIAQELRQFETIFLFDVVDGAAEARIFTPEEELGFAGHPVLGAAAVLHADSGRPDSEHQEWSLRVGGRPLAVTTAARDGGVVWAEMDQGPAETLSTLSLDVATRLAAAVGVAPEQLRRDLPTQVVTTGLQLSPAAGHRRRARGEPRRRPRPAVDAPRGGRRVRLRARARTPRGPHVGQQRADRGRGDGQRRRTHGRLPDRSRSAVRRRALPGPPGHVRGSPQPHRGAPHRDGLAPGRWPRRAVQPRDDRDDRPAGPGFTADPAPGPARPHRGGWPRRACDRCSSRAS